MSKTPTEIKSLARAHTESAVRVLAGIMNEPQSSGWGKPAQAITGGDDDDKPVTIQTVERLIVQAPNKDG
jgi:hypothetical protein